MKLSFTRDNLFKGMNLATGLMILVLLPILIPVLGYMMLKVGINAFRSEEFQENNMWAFFSGIATTVFVLMILLIGSLMIAFGGFTVNDTMPTEDDDFKQRRDQGYDRLESFQFGCCWRGWRGCCCGLTMRQFGYLVQVCWCGLSSFHVQRFGSHFMCLERKTSRKIAGAIVRNAVRPRRYRDFSCGKFNLLMLLIDLSP